MYAKNKITNEKRPARARETKKTLRAFTTVTALSTHANNARFHYGHCAFNTRKQCALSLRSLRFQHANSARFHYGHCTFNTRAKRNKMSMQKTNRATKWQPKRAMWITTTRHRPMTRFLHACGSVSGQMRRWPCGRLGARVCVHVCGWCASVRVCGCASMRKKSLSRCALVRVCMCVG
jgi:hypothetical protein